MHIAESLTILPLIYEPAIWGVTHGCFLTNLIGAMAGFDPTGLIDCVVGTSATLLAAICAFRLRDRKIKGIPVLSILMPVVWNFVFVGIELGVILFPDNIVAGSLICGAEVAAGELIAVIIGCFLVQGLARTGIFN